MKNHFLSILMILLSLTVKAQNAEEVTVTTSGGVTLYGTLVIPEITDEIPPLVIMIAGSGPTDRNGNNPQMKNNSLLFLSDGLVKNGVATLRYDKLAIGKSVASTLREEDLSFDQYVDDVLLWIQKYSNDTRFSQIVVLGHSEGALIGVLAAQKSKEVRAYISLAGMGRNMSEVLREQLTKQAPQVMPVVNPIIDSLKKGKKVENIMPQLNVLFRPSVQPFLISQMKYNPADEIKKLTIPVLIVRGDKDIQISEEDYNALCAAKPDAQKLVVPNMNHVLKETDTMDTQTQLLKTYINPELPVVPLLIRTIAKFSK